MTEMRMEDGGSRMAPDAASVPAPSSILHPPPSHHPQRAHDERRAHRRRRMRRHGRRAYIRSVYFLPSMATLGNAICGFVSGGGSLRA